MFAIVRLGGRHLVVGTADGRVFRVDLFSGGSISFRHNQFLSFTDKNRLAALKVPEVYLVGKCQFIPTVLAERFSRSWRSRVKLSEELTPPIASPRNRRTAF